MADPWKREKIYDLMAVLKGVVEARKKVHIFLNVREKDLHRLLKALPALKRPTISPLSEKGWYAVNTVVAKSELLGLVPVLRRMAQGLVVHEPEQVLPLEELGGSKND
jgi:ATP phosphoribosyltransferase